tara:strand:+ start:300 stop:698 length:399 start_codon:yes stop_codon:yes gene_type:complete
MVSKLQTIGMLIALVSAIGGGFYTWGTFNQRLDVIEKNIIKIEKKKFTINETVDLTSVYSDIKEINNKVNEDIKELSTSLLSQIDSINIKIQDSMKNIETIRADIKINGVATEYLNTKIEELKVLMSNPLLN